MIIVESSVWIDYYGRKANTHTVWLHHEARRQRLGLTDLILCEVLQGFRTKSAFRLALEELSGFETFDSGGAELAVASAQNYLLLRSRGITVRTTVDCLIATFCIVHGHSLLHRDRDFDAFEQHLGLRVVHPSIH